MEEVANVSVCTPLGGTSATLAVSNQSVTDMDVDPSINVNHVDTHQELSERLDPYHVVAYTYLTPVLLGTGILTNLLNIVVLHRGAIRASTTAKRGVRQKTQQQQRIMVFRYLSGLAVSQLLACLSIIPSLLFIDRGTLSYGFAFYYAHFELLLVNTPTASCVYILVGLSADRYVAACRPSSYRKVSSPSVATVRIACSLLLPLLFYVPHCFLATVGCNNQGTGWTINSNGTEEYMAWLVWAWIVELCHRLLPSLLIVIFNIKVILKIRKVNRQFAERNINRQISDDQSLEACEMSKKSDASLVDKQPQTDKNSKENINDSSKMNGASHKMLPSSQSTKEIEEGSQPLVKETREPTRPCTKDSIRKAKGRNSREQLERQLSNLLVAIIVVFLSTTLPAALLALTDNVSARFESFGHEIFRAIANVTELVGFSLNFVLYFTFVREFQEWLRVMCLTKLPLRGGSPEINEAHGNPSVTV